MAEVEIGYAVHCFTSSKDAGVSFVQRDLFLIGFYILTTFLISGSLFLHLLRVLLKHNT